MNGLEALIIPSGNSLGRMDITGLAFWNQPRNYLIEFSMKDAKEIY